MKKRLLSLVLCLVPCFSLLPAQALAWEDSERRLDTPKKNIGG